MDRPLVTLATRAAILLLAWFAIVPAVSWPWKWPRRMSQAEFVANAPAIRAALLHPPEALARGVAAVRRASPGSRVAMVGASLGVPPAVAAIPLVRVEALVLVDGA